MTKEETVITKWLDDRANKACEPFEERVDEFRARVLECDEMAEALPDLKDYILNDGESKEWHSLKKRVDIASEDRVIFMDIISDFNKELAAIRQPIQAHKSAIINETNHVIAAKAGLLKQKESGRDMGLHEKQFQAQMHQLINVMANAGIPEELQAGLKKVLLHIDNYELLLKTISF